MPKREEESPYSRFFWMIVASAVAGFGTTLIGAGAIYASQREMAVKIESITSQLAEMRTQFSEGTRQRYTSEDAGRDRAGIFSLDRKTHV